MRERKSEGKFERFYLRLRVWGEVVVFAIRSLKRTDPCWRLSKWIIEKRRNNATIERCGFEYPPAPSTLLLRSKEGTIMYAKN